MTPALKEWAVVVHALLEGEQILDVRKGGLHEDGRHFAVQSNRLWLYPTAEHQKPELLKEPYRHWIDLASASPVGEPIRFDCWADIVGVATITEPEQLDAIASKLDLDRRVRGVTVQLEEARPPLGPRAACAPARGADHGALARGVRRLHLLGRHRRPARHPPPWSPSRRCPTSRSTPGSKAQSRRCPCWPNPATDPATQGRATQRNGERPKTLPVPKVCWKSPPDGTRGGDQLPLVSTAVRRSNSAGGPAF